MTIDNGAVESRPLGGVGRRSAALIADCLLLWVIGLALGYIAYDVLTRLGRFGPIVGFVVATGYFGLLDSSVGGGRTLGKRLFGLQVVNSCGLPPSVLRSLGRTLVLSAPWFYSGWPWHSQVLYTFVGFWLSLAQWIPLASIYLVLCNRRSRQGVHDLVAGTFVVTTRSTTGVHPRNIWPIHFAVLAAGVIAYALVFVQARSEIARSAPSANGPQWKLAEAALAAINRTNHVQTCLVGGRFFRTDGSASDSVPSLEVFATWKTRPESVILAAAEVAEVVVRTIGQMKADDAVEVTIEYGYDIGIARSHPSERMIHTAAEWQEILRASKHS